MVKGKDKIVFLHVIKMCVIWGIAPHS